ncbi:MAG: haloacid dehalogenase type II [Pseudomonadota bacterium]
MPQRPSLLLFDVFGTVVDWRSSLIRQIPGQLAAHGVIADPAVIADRWRQLYQPSMQAIRSGARPWVPLDDLHRESLDVVLTDLGCEALPADARDALNRVWHRLDGWADAAPGLRELRRFGYCCALSNGNLRMMAAIARHAGLSWDQILGAEWSKAYKPTPRVYLDATAAFAVEPASTIMVAAHNSDLDAARALGFQTAFVRRPTEHGPDQTTDLDPTTLPDYVADDLVDLANELGRVHG